MKLTAFSLGTNSVPGALCALAEPLFVTELKRQNVNSENEIGSIEKGKILCGFVIKRPRQGRLVARSDKQKFTLFRKLKTQQGRSESKSLEGLVVGEKLKSSLKVCELR